MNDLRFALRQLLKNPGFTAVAVLTLALGIGAGTAVFSLVNAILLRSLPVPNPHDLRLIHWSGGSADFRPQYLGGRKGSSREPGQDSSGRLTGDSVSLSVFQALREQCANHADIFAYSRIFRPSTARARREAIVARGMLVSDNFFSGLAVRPLMGRLLGPEDERNGATPAVVISYRWWEEQFDLDRDVLGQSIMLRGSSFTVIGVLPREFAGVRPGEGVEFYALLSAHPQLHPNLSYGRGAGFDPWVVPLMARLKPGVSDAQFQAALNVVFTREAETVLKTPAVWITDGRAGTNEDRLQYGRPLRLLLGVVGVVLLVVCANVAGLMLARGVARQHEFAVRSALGADRGRLVRQSLTESLLVAFLGGGLGMLIAIWGKTALFGLIASPQSGLHYEAALDLRVLGFAVAASLVTALLSGLLPAVRAASVDPRDGLKDRGTFGAPRLRSGRILVTAQITLSLLLVGGAGLFVRTLVNLTHIDTGFAMDHLLVFELNPGNVGYVPPRTTAFYESVLQSLAAIPGVRSAALNARPLQGDSIAIKEFKILNGASGPEFTATADITCVNETFFTTMGIPVLLGRELRASDDAGAIKVAVVNETFVRKHLPGRNPIGVTMDLPGFANLQIVGVCRDARYLDIKREASPLVHFSIRQLTTPGASFILRTAVPPLGVATAARSAVAAVDPNVPLFNISTQEQVRDATISQPRLFAMLCGSLALLAALLSCIGLYGLIAYQIAGRTREIGIRLALGATRRQIGGAVLREALLLTGTGVAIGIPLTFALTQLIRGNLYGVGSFDPFTYGGAIVMFLAVALAAAWIPARRAVKVNPMEALRYE